MIESCYGCDQRRATCELTDHLCNEKCNQSKACKYHKHIAFVSCLEITDNRNRTSSTGYKCQFISKHAKHQKCNRHLNCGDPRLCISIGKSSRSRTRNKGTGRCICRHNRHRKHNTVHISSADKILVLFRCMQTFLCLFTVRKTHYNIE